MSGLAGVLSTHPVKRDPPLGTLLFSRSHPNGKRSSPTLRVQNDSADSGFASFAAKVSIIRHSAYAPLLRECIILPLPGRWVFFASGWLGTAGLPPAASLSPQSRCSRQRLRSRACPCPRAVLRVPVSRAGASLPYKHTNIRKIRRLRNSRVNSFSTFCNLAIPILQLESPCTGRRCHAEKRNAIKTFLFSKF